MFSFFPFSMLIIQLVFISTCILKEYFRMSNLRSALAVLVVGVGTEVEKLTHDVALTVTSGVKERSAAELVFGVDCAIALSD